MARFKALTKPLGNLEPAGKWAAVAAVTTGVAAATAAWVAHRAQLAETRNPPSGKFVTVDGVQVHYLERGTGTPLVLLHGNVVRLEDFVAGGLVDRLSQDYRVIAFDRPGFGFSERPRDRMWTADAQAALIHGALLQLGIERATVLGHSWGALVAASLALRESAPVQQLILISGYYYPSPRLDVAISAPLALPVLGDALRYTVSAIFARLMLTRTAKAMFAPQPVPPAYLSTLQREMLVRPVQIRANAEDAAFMISSAESLRKRYKRLRVPTTILAGGADKVVDPDAHARKLHEELSYSELRIFPGVGHMVHHACPDEVVAAIEATMGRASLPRVATGQAADPVFE